MAVNDPITALEYNNIYNVMAPIVGTAATGYGRNLSSSTVVGGSTPGVSDRVTSVQHRDLFFDLQAGHVHQYGSVNGALVLADVAADTTVDWQDVVDLNTIANAVTSFNHVITDFPSANFTTDLLRTSGGVSCSSVRSTPWGGVSQVQAINHAVTLNFGSNLALKYFLNAGGEIRIDGSLTGGTSGTANTKDWDWAQILSAMGTIRFGLVGTNWRTESVGGTGTGSLIALASLSTNTASPTTIFTKQGGVSTAAAPTGTSVYDNNFYQIRAALVGAYASATSLYFEIRFEDQDAGSGFQDEGVNDPVDEPVTGTVTSNVYTYTPDSEYVLDAVTYTAIRWQYPGQSRFAPVGTINSSL